MPVYVYRCMKCRNAIEVRHGMADPGPTHCPTCVSESLVRVVTAVSLGRSTQTRSSDLSWVDKDMARRMRKGVNGPVNPALSRVLDKMERPS